MVASESEITIIVTARDRFGITREALEDLYLHTPEPFELIYVDAGSPAKHADYLRSAAKDRGFKLLRYDCYLSPNWARNAALPHAQTRYVAFVENDVVYSDGWLSALIDCAEETGADVVCPLICEGRPSHTIIHCTGGEFTNLPDRQAFFDDGTNRLAHYDYVMEHFREVLAECRDKLVRKEIGVAEFHCVLVRRSILDRLGRFDENMLATRENADFSFSVIAAGGRIYFEPASVVTFLIAGQSAPLEWSDWPYYMLRWSNKWERRSVDYYCRKWDLYDPDFIAERRKARGWRRRFATLTPALRKLPGLRGNAKIASRVELLLRPFEIAFNYLLVFKSEATMRGRRP